ncbi:MAG: hypothetical protein G01um101417_350 [Parcubacteria group bacterium Gr01-1014_17]|nr:MAG: hypothetical protein G01um101417_350 [Parcubacteria group bacterium Gr01-1014_17]
MELMVVIALFTIITGAALMNHARFGEGILATNLAYDVALSFREAQSYGIAVREPSSGAGTFSFSYGLHFSGGDSFVFFNDRDNADRLYGGTSEFLKVYRFERGSRIESFCGVPASGALECRRFDAEGKVVVGGAISHLDITFKRPVPDATFVTGLNNANIVRYQSARITIVSPRGRERRTVEVFETGQISIRNN